LTRISSAPVLAAEACGAATRLDGVEGTSRTVRRSRSSVGAGRLEALGVRGLVVLGAAAAAGVTLGGGAVTAAAFGLGRGGAIAGLAAGRRAAALAATRVAARLTARRATFLAALLATLFTAFGATFLAAVRTVFLAAFLPVFFAAFRAFGLLAARAAFLVPDLPEDARRRAEALGTFFFATVFFAMASPLVSLTVEPK
jgi:hypothetical protein